MISTPNNGFNFLKMILFICKNGKNPAVRVSKWIERGYDGPQDRKNILKEQFLRMPGNCGNVYAMPCTDYYNYLELGETKPENKSKQGYPHDMDALRTFVNLGGEITKLLSVGFMEETATNRDRIVCAGSSKANPLAREYIPTFDVKMNGKTKPDGFPKLLVNPESLPYWFGIDHISEKVQVISRMDPGTESKKIRKCIIKNNGSGATSDWVPYGYSKTDKLKKDFLLVSCLPRNADGGDIIVLSGGHGAGTHSIKLFLDNNASCIRDLKEIRDLSSSSKYYQYVLEVDTEDKRGIGTFPTKLRLSRDCEPRDLGNNPIPLLSSHSSSDT